MTKPKPRPERVVDAVLEALTKERAKRKDGLKPIEVVKVAICAYQDHANAISPGTKATVESPDRAGLRRGTQAAVDRLLFNANYWLAAYEDRIVEACDPEDAEQLLKAVTVWSTHTLKLNTLSNDEAVATFERFCPPFAINNRKGAGEGKGKGPIAEFEKAVEEAAASQPERSEALTAIAVDMRQEAAAYESLPAASALDALFAILPAWCLQDRIALVSGGWWDDPDVMLFLADALRDRFVEIGYGEAPCQYFHDSMLEAIDAYQLDVSSSGTPLSELPIPDLIGLVHAAREAHPNFEADGYGDTLPAWLAAKEQLVWNTVVCSLYGPGSARPLLTASPGLLSNSGKPAGSTGSDVITDLAKSSFKRYSSDRAESGKARGYKAFSDQPQDLRNSSFEHIKSIPSKLDVLGYEIVPDGSCYPAQKITALSPSEVECLAILEHRRWIAERTKAGWVYGEKRDVEAKTSPYLVPWEDLPDRAREWNRSAVRNIPALLADENLAIAKK
ncbi:MAG: hypothetical protein IJ111_06330 [Eggerthellaceae bacterium]|nr:hypothetical protein [Eggerthellaceae bacterium]